MNKFEKIPLENKRITRRDFLKKTGALIGGATITGAGLTMLLNDKKETKLSTNADVENLSPPTPEELKKIQDKDSINKIQITPEQKKIKHADARSIENIFSQQIETSQQITIDNSVRESIYQYWTEQYRPGGKEYKTGLLTALEQMKPWMHDMVMIFKKYNIPEEFVFLAIAESHFKMEAVSNDKAVGPYQIMKRTAKSYGLTITQTYDERQDPLKSAELCARHLRDSYENFDHNWSFALMDYNGGITNEFVKHLIKQESKLMPDDFQNTVTHTINQGETLSSLAKKYNTTVTMIARANNFTSKEMHDLHIGQTIIIPQQSRQVTMQEFNIWLQNVINSVIEQKISHTHVVKPGDNLSTIAKKYDTTTKAIMSQNNLSDTTILAGQKLLIPQNSKKRRKTILNALSGFRENINYPEKFYAIRDVIKEYKLCDLNNTPEPAYINIYTPTLNVTKFTHTVKSGDTISKIAMEILRKHKNAYPRKRLEKELIIQNKLGNKAIIRPGQQISVNIPIERPATLKDIALKYKVPLGSLKEINPAIKNTSAPLPSNALIHLPKKA